MGETAEGKSNLDWFLEMHEKWRENHPGSAAQAVLFLAYIAFVTDEDEYLRIAKDLYTRMESVEDPGSRISGRLGMGFVHVMEKNKKEAAATYEYLISQDDLFWMLARACIDPRRILGIIASASGDYEKAVGHFEESRWFCEKAGYKSELAWGHYSYAEALLSRDATGDREKASELLAEGLSFAQKMGMKLLEGRIQDRIIELEESSDDRPIYPDGLTEREVEVLRLVAKGFTNKDVAKLLHISVKTVATHLAHVFEKTGCANRAEATAYAVRQGLTEE
jgi:DNA-binding CsgD family transcriptional regulator